MRCHANLELARCAGRRWVSKMLCLAPLLLAGYMSTITTSWHHGPNEDGAVVELQTCERGLGAHIRATSSGLYGLGAQYGLGTEVGPVSLTIQQRLGFSYVDHTNVNLPLRTQFEVGLQGLIGYGRYRIAVDYWHLSNAHLKAPNIGMDMASVMIGVTF